MLKEFFDHFELTADDSVKLLWRYNECETKFGNRLEISLVGQSAILMELPTTGSIELLVMQTNDQRIYKHVAYLVSLLASYAIGELQRTELKLALHGRGYQGCIGAAGGFAMEHVTATAMIEATDRFGNPVDREWNNVEAVIFRNRHV